MINTSLNGTMKISQEEIKCEHFDFGNNFLVTDNINFKITIIVKLSKLEDDIKSMKE